MDWGGGVVRHIFPFAQMAKPGDFPPAREIGMHFLGFKRARLKKMGSVTAASQRWAAPRVFPVEPVK
jgi:hypothetical protein